MVRPRPLPPPKKECHAIEEGQTRETSPSVPSRGVVCCFVCLFVCCFVCLSVGVVALNESFFVFFFPSFF